MPPSHTGGRTPQRDGTLEPWERTQEPWEGTQGPQGNRPNGAVRPSGDLHARHPCAKIANPGLGERKNQTYYTQPKRNNLAPAQQTRIEEIEKGHQARVTHDKAIGDGHGRKVDRRSCDSKGQYGITHKGKNEISMPENTSRNGADCGKTQWGDHIKATGRER